MEPYIFARRVIWTLGGTSKVAQLLEAHTSTVHSWKQSGIPSSRLAHLKLAVAAAEKPIDWETGLRPGETVEEREREEAQKVAA